MNDKNTNKFTGPILRMACNATSCSGSGGGKTRGADTKDAEEEEVPDGVEVGRADCVCKGVEKKGLYTPLPAVARTEDGVK